MAPVFERASAPLPDCCEEVRGCLSRHDQQFLAVDKRMILAEHSIADLLASRKQADIEIHNLAMVVQTIASDLKAHIERSNERAERAHEQNRADLLEHEKREFQNHKAVLKEIIKTLAWGIFIIGIIVMGAVFWVVRWEFLRGGVLGG